MNQDNRYIPLHERVNLLFATVIDADGREIETQVVAEALTTTLGRPVTVTDLDALRQPDAEGGDGDLLTALTKYFDMPEAYLSDQVDEYHTMYRHLRMLISMRDRRIPHVGLRASSDQLSDEAVIELTKYIESLD